MNLLPDELLEVGPFLIPHLDPWRRQLSSECSLLHQAEAKLNRKIAWKDTLIGESKGKQAERASLIKKRKELQREAEILGWRIFERGRDLARLNAAFNHAIDTYARTSCLQLTTKMHGTLPRELRDIVYSYVLDWWDVDSVLKQIRLQFESECCTQSRCSFTVPYYMDTRFVPLAVAKEILESIADGHGWTLALEKPELVPKNVRLFLDMKALHLPVPISRFFAKSDLRIRLHLAGLLSVLDFEAVPHGPSQLSIFINSIRELLLDVPMHPNRVLMVEMWETRLGESEKKVLRSGLLDTFQELKMKEFKDVVVSWYITRSSWLGEPKWDIRRIEDVANRASHFKRIDRYCAMSKV